MLKVVYFLLTFAISGLLVAQNNALTQMLPGQLPRQSLSGGLIYRCLFDKQSEAGNDDGWPLGWTKKEGDVFPRHIVQGNTENPNPFGNYVYRMNMAGGAAAVFSPTIPVRAGMSYTISAYVETNTLAFDEVSILANFYGDDAVKPIRTIESNKIRNTNGWQKLTIGPIVADMPKVKRVSVGLLVMPTDREDYNAQVNFTNVEIRESPTISLAMANANHQFFTTRELHVSCHFSGVDPAQSSVLFILEDHTGHVMDRKKIELMDGNHPAARFVVTPQNADTVIRGTAKWDNLPIRLFGFYRIRVATPEEYIRALRLPPDQTFDDPLNATEPLTFVVMPSSSFYPGGEFGWNLDGWTLDEIQKALPTLDQSGLSRLKIPAWLSADAPPGQREMLRNLCNELTERQVHLIGLLNPLPNVIRAQLPRGQVNAASIMSSNPNLWGDSLQLSLQTLSLLVKDWQWTSDTDQSLMGLFFDPSGKMFPAGSNRFSAFQKLFDKNQFGFGVGLTWNWYQDVPEGEFPFPNCFLNFPIDASITAKDAATFFAEMPPVPFRRSVSIAPLPADDYTLDSRITTFVQSLVLMKASGIDSICLTAPRDEQTGILRRDGTPNELYLPWRTTATLLSGSRLLGSVTLPNRSTNYCFDKGGGRCLMVVWNDLATSEKPVQETLYLGNGLEMIDVWGRPSVPEQAGNNQTIPVTQTPVFITGLNIDVARFRLSMQTGLKTISAVPGRTDTIPFTYKNESAVPVSIQITPQGPREGDWVIKPPTQTANLESGVAGAGAFDLTLTPSADTGRRLFQYDVKITGGSSPEFAVYDEMMIGNPDVYMEFVSRLKANGDIELIQIFVNNSDRSFTYDFRLTVPGRAGQKSRVARQDFGRAEYVYTIQNGKALINAGVTSMFLRATPVNDGGQGGLGEPMVYTIPLISE
jgi:hypothetical protein